MRDFGERKSGGEWPRGHSPSFPYSVIPLLWRGGVPEATRTRTQCGVGGVCRLLTWMCIAGVGMKRIFSDREFV